MLVWSNICINTGSLFYSSIKFYTSLLYNNIFSQFSLYYNYATCKLHKHNILKVLNSTVKFNLKYTYPFSQDNSRLFKIQSQRHYISIHSNIYRLVSIIKTGSLCTGQRSLLISITVSHLTLIYPKLHAIYIFYLHFYTVQTYKITSENW